MLADFFNNASGTQTSTAWFQKSRHIETGEKRSIKGTFIRHGGAGGTAKLQAFVDGQWFDVPNTNQTNTGYVEVEVFADAIRATITGANARTVAFETSEVLVEEVTT